MRRRGSGLTEVQAKFLQLIEQGVNNSEACRILGIHRKTGTRWRLGRTVHNSVGESVHYPPVVARSSPAERHPRYLSAAEREQVGQFRRRGWTLRQIGAELGRAASTISRELRRNANGEGRYDAAHADRLAVQRQARARPRRIATDEVLRELVNDRLKKRWSPEQVAHELRVQFAAQPRRRLCMESIYAAIYDPEVAVTRPVRRRRRRRRVQVQGLERHGRLNGMTMIDQRPAEVADRLQPGHWEGDRIMGAQNRSSIGTLVERHSRYVKLIHLPAGVPASEAIRDGVTAAFADLPAGLRRTLTWDQGKEMALHRQLAARCALEVYFCDAHSPWQRGSNENTNGLLRDYFPKGTDLSSFTPEQLEAIEDEINQRPRKTLGWARPADLLAALTSPEGVCCDVG